MEYAHHTLYIFTHMPTHLNKHTAKFIVHIGLCIHGSLYCSNSTVNIVYDCSGLLKLSVEQKCDIATREVEILREDMARKDKEYEQLLDSYKVGALISCTIITDYITGHQCRGRDQAWRG